MIFDSAPEPTKKNLFQSLLFETVYHKTTSNSINFHDQPRSSPEQSENYSFFQQNKINTKNTMPEINLIIIHQIIFQQMMKNTIIKIINDFIQAKDLVLKVLTNQIISNQTHEMKKHDNLEIIHYLTTTIFNNKTQLTHNHTNQPTNHNETSLPYYLQQHEITKTQLTNFSQMPHAAESLQML